MMGRESPETDSEITGNLESLENPGSLENLENPESLERITGSLGCIESLEEITGSIESLEGITGSLESIESPEETALQDNTNMMIETIKGTPKTVRDHKDETTTTTETTTEENHVLGMPVKITTIHVVDLIEKIIEAGVIEGIDHLLARSQMLGKKHHAPLHQKKRKNQSQPKLNLLELFPRRNHSLKRLRPQMLSPPSA